MPEPSREAIEAARSAVKPLVNIPVRAVEAAFPIIQRDVAREIADNLRSAVEGGSGVGPMCWRNAADHIEREFGGDS